MKSFGEPRIHFASIDTTMREAEARAAAGGPEGLLVTADEQTQGRGRQGRPWLSKPGEGLYFSLVLRPRLSAVRSIPLTLAFGLGVARGIGETSGLRCDIRWPNDVLISDKKIAGVLVEMSAERGRVAHVIAGVGVNVNQPSFPSEIERIATSLRLETGCEFDREALLSAILRRLEDYYEMFLSRGVEPILAQFARASSYVRGKRVVIEGVEARLTGVTAGLDPSGVLLLETPGGEIRPIIAGSVRPWQE